MTSGGEIKKNITKDLGNVQWCNILNTENENVDYFLEAFSHTINQIIDHHIPMKRVSNKYLNFNM